MGPEVAERGFLHQMFNKYRELVGSCQRALSHSLSVLSARQPVWSSEREIFNQKYGVRLPERLYGPDTALLAS